MDFYKMTDTERQILINQYNILKKGEKDQFKIKELNQKIEYLESGYIYLFKNINSLENIFHEQESIELMDILMLHDIITISAKTNNMNGEDLSFDYNNDGVYPYFAEKVIESPAHPAFKNFKIINSHGTKNLKDHKKQLKYWKYSLNKKIVLTQNELATILNYHQLP